MRTTHCMILSTRDACSRVCSVCDVGQYWQSAQSRRFARFCIREPYFEIRWIGKCFWQGYVESSTSHLGMLSSIKVSSKSTFENGESKKEFLQLLWWELEQAWRRQGLAQLGDCGQESQQCWLGVGVEGGLGQQNIQEEQVCVQTEASSNTGECLCKKMLFFWTSTESH